MHDAQRWLLLATLALATACGDKPAGEAVPSGPAPDSFKVAFETSKGPIVVQVNRAWSPLGADRFYQLTQSRFFDDERFFRVLPHYIAQFGLNDNPKLNEKWRALPIADDTLRLSNLHGTLSFASEGRNSRSHQLFFNMKDNPSLDSMGFIPIGRVVSGLANVDSLYDGYDDTPRQNGIRARGNKYLAQFPKLDFIRTARVVP